MGREGEAGARGGHCNTHRSNCFSSSSLVVSSSPPCFLGAAAAAPLPSWRAGSRQVQGGSERVAPRVRTRAPRSGIRVEAARSVWMPCGRQGHSPLATGRMLAIARREWGSKLDGRDAIAARFTRASRCGCAARAQNSRLKKRNLSWGNREIDSRPTRRLAYNACPLGSLSFTSALWFLPTNLPARNTYLRRR